MSADKSIEDMNKSVAELEAEIEAFGKELDWKQRAEAAEEQTTTAEQSMEYFAKAASKAEARVKVLEVALEWFARGQQAGTTTLQQQGFARQALAQEQNPE
jgi:ABC-type hemin transport system substrate-binding protein